MYVSVAQQHAWVCAGAKQINDTAVTTGTTVIRNGVDDNTPTGTWQIQAKYTDTYLKGSDANGSWDDYVQYWMPFDGEIGFHDASWQTFPFGSSQYQTNGSHGCVHVPTAFIAWFYNWAHVGTTVVITG
jgi:lipoprotein-anchoring transpeptidase ErfK/SrfK